MKAPKIYNCGLWTENQFRNTVNAHLRRLNWAPRNQVLKDAFIDHRENPKTGRQKMVYLCAHCNDNFFREEVQADHVEPVIPVTGFVSFDDSIKRMFCEKEGFQILCKPCHTIKSNEENEQRREYKKNEQGK